MEHLDEHHRPEIERDEAEQKLESLTLLEGIVLRHPDVFADPAAMAKLDAEFLTVLGVRFRERKQIRAVLEAAIRGDVTDEHADERPTPLPQPERNGSDDWPPGIVASLPEAWL